MALQIGQTFKLGSGIKTGVAPGGTQFGVGAGRSVKIIGSRNIGGQQYYDIRDLGPGGGTGWTTAAGLQTAFSGGGGGASIAPGPSAESIAAKKAFQQILSQQAGLKKEGAAIQTGFEQFVSGQEAVPDLRKRLAEELGIPELAAQLEPLRKRSLQLEGLLENLPETISGIAGRESKARRDLLLASKGGELDRAIAANARAQELFAGQVTGAQAELVAQLSAFGQQYAREIVPWQTKITAFSERAARESSAFSTAVQASLNAELQGIQRLSDIAEAKLQRVHDFALQEQQFLNDLRKISAQGAQSAAKEQRDREAKEKNDKVFKRVISSFTSTVQNAGSNFAAVSDTLAQYVGDYPEYIDDFTKYLEAQGIQLQDQ